MTVKPTIDQLKFVVTDDQQSRHPYKISDNHAMTIALSQLVGQPIKSWRPNDDFSHGRIKAVCFETWPDRDPLLPIPMIGEYPPKFIDTMRMFAHHLSLWLPQKAEQRTWFNTGNAIIEMVIKSSYRLGLSPDERMAFESCLRYALAHPVV